MMDSRSFRQFLVMLTALACFLAGVTSFAAEIEAAKVSRIVDGDTIHVINESGARIKVRLAGIDCPERDQPWGAEATKALSNMLSGQTVDIEIVDIDRYGRTVGRVYRYEQNINRALVGAGHCWVYSRYARDGRLFELEEEAREAKSGLWGLPESKQVPPWEWRRTR